MNRDADGPAARDHHANVVGPANGNGDGILAVPGRAATGTHANTVRPTNGNGDGIPAAPGRAAAGEAPAPASGTAAARALGVLRGALLALLVVAYPFLVVTGLAHADARTLGALLLLVLAVAALAGGGRASRTVSLLVRRFGVLVAVAAAAAATNHPLALKLVPTLTSLALLATFAASLRREPSIVGRFATAMHDGFPDFLLPYCRKVTWMWCGFFAGNAAVGAALALVASDEAWAWYTGFFAYVAVGALAAGEYVFHKTRFRFYEDGPADRLWRRLCPPERTALGRRTLEWQTARRMAPPESSR